MNTLNDYGRMLGAARTPCGIAAVERRAQLSASPRIAAKVAAMCRERERALGLRDGGDGE